MPGIPTLTAYNHEPLTPGVYGRRVLYADPPERLTAKTIGAILNDVLPLHMVNAAEIDYLHWFARGDQPVISRKKEIRPEIKNIVVENRAFEIVEFKKGYEFSHPIQYTNAGQKDIAPIDLLNAFARIDGKEAKDLELAEWFYQSGNAYRICLPKRNVTVDDAPYFSDVLDPRETFIVYSNRLGHEPLFAGAFIDRGLNITSGPRYICNLFTDSTYFIWESEIIITDYSTTAPKTRKNHAYGRIPIIEYVLNENRMGYVELCFWLFNAINTTGSNRIDAIEQFVQALLVFINCTLPKDKDGNPIVPRSGDAIEVGNGQGTSDVKYLVAQLDQDQTQITKDDLLRSIYEICGVPDRQNRNQGGGDTGQAVVLRNGWGAAEARAMSTEKSFKKSEMEYLKLVLKICRDTQNVDIGDITLRDIGIKFTRNRSDAMQTKAQTLKMMLDCGVNPEDAYEYCEMFNDPSAVWLKSKKWQEEQAEKDLAAQERLLAAQAKATSPNDNGAMSQAVDATSEVEKLGNPAA